MNEFGKPADVQGLITDKKGLGHLFYFYCIMVPILQDSEINGTGQIKMIDFSIKCPELSKCFNGNINHFDLASPIYLSASSTQYQVSDLKNGTLTCP